MKRIQLTSMAALIGAGMTVSACSSVEGQGALLGGVAGAGVGLLVCGGDEQCIAALTVAGAAAGYVAGLYVKNNKDKYETAEQFYTAEIDQTRQYNQQLASYLTTTETELAALDTRIASLESQRDAGQDVSAQLTATQQQLATLDEDLEDSLSTVEEQIDTRKQVLADINSEIAKGDEVDTYTAQKETLEAELVKLAEARDAFTEQRSVLASQRTRIRS